MKAGGDVETDQESSRRSAAESSDPLLQMQGIVKRYGATTALNAVDFEVDAGEIHALLGENGAGKTTLMHILAGLTRPDAGVLCLRGEPAVLPSPQEARRQGIAMVHQHFMLVPAFTIAENLAMDTPRSPVMFRPGPYRPEQAAQGAFEKAASLGWNLPTNTRVSELSVGTQQRVEIVKALATEARLLIFDEPTAVLTSREIEELFVMLRRLRDGGSTIILIAHKLAEILAVADRVTVLRRGNRVASAPVAETNAPQLATWMTGTVGTPSVMGITPSHAAAPNTSSPNSLTVEELTVSGDRGEQVLRGLSLTASKGEIFGIGGVDGNGQSELAEALTGLRRIQSGRMAWKGEAFPSASGPRIGYIPQDRRRMGLAPTMTVGENLLFDAVREKPFRRGPFLKKKALRTLAESLISAFDIRTSSQDIPASALSGGNQQKIVVARVLRSAPDIIVAMNPTRGLDIGATRFVHQQLRAARDRGTAIVLISTDLDEIAALADRAAILTGGRLTEYDVQASDSAQIGLLLGGVTTGGDSPH